MCSFLPPKIHVVISQQIILKSHYDGDFDPANRVKWALFQATIHILHGKCQMTFQTL